MEPQQTTIDSSTRTRRPIGSLGPEEDHSRNGVHTLGLNAEKKGRRPADGGIFLLTFLFIGLGRFAR
jgi:hypothetical protein